MKNENMCCAHVRYPRDNTPKGIHLTRRKARFHPSLFTRPRKRAFSFPIRTIFTSTSSPQFSTVKIMQENQLMTQSMNFAVATVLTLDAVEKRGVLKNQLLRSSTSIGANIREAQYASSRADFIAKLQIALKECNESEYWLELMANTQSLEPNKAEALLNDCRRIRFMLIRSIKTAKENAPFSASSLGRMKHER